MSKKGSNQWDSKPIDGRQQQQQQQQQQEQDEEVENRDADMHFEVGDADPSARDLEVNPIQRIRVEGERRGGGAPRMVFKMGNISGSNIKIGPTQDVHVQSFGTTRGPEQARANPVEHIAGNSGPGDISRDGQNEIHLSKLVAQRPKRTEPLVVKVKPASQMRKPPQTECYEMTKKFRGRALIINNEVFSGLSKRNGSMADVTNLRELLKQLHFKVNVHMNLTAEFIKEMAKDFAEEDNSHSQMIVVAIMSHGDNGMIFGTDRIGIKDEDILKMFHNEAAPQLRGKPKFFIFSHCRGEKKDFGVHLEFDGPAGKSPTWEDMIIAYPTVPGNVSLRNTQMGTWFIECLCEAFMNHACELDLIDLIKLVMHYLKDKDSKEGFKQSCVYEDRHLYKKVYFNPGLYEEN